MPPPSPVPGWARGDVWRERTASRRMPVRAYRRPRKALRPGLRGRPAGSSLDSSRSDALGRARRLGRWRRPRFLLLGLGLGRAVLVLVLAPEGEVDPHEGLLLLLADGLVGHDG